MEIISLLQSHFVRYITINGVHPRHTYDYKKRGMLGLPVFDTTMHIPKPKGGSWTYIATKAGASLADLHDEDRLYIGAQTLDRMFRGDGMGAKNFHHAQMRSGNGADTPLAYLNAGGRIEIHLIDAQRLLEVLKDVPAALALTSWLGRPDRHVGYWLEQFILATQDGRWRWNSAKADLATRTYVRDLGL